MSDKIEYRRLVKILARREGEFRDLVERQVSTERMERLRNIGSLIELSDEEMKTIESLQLSEFSDRAQLHDLEEIVHADEQSVQALSVQTKTALDKLFDLRSLDNVNAMKRQATLESRRKGEHNRLVKVLASLDSSLWYPEVVIDEAGSTPYLMRMYENHTMSGEHVMMDVVSQPSLSKIVASSSGVETEIYTDGTYGPQLDTESRVISSGFIYQNKPFKIYWQVGADPVLLENLPVRFSFDSCSLQVSFSSSDTQNGAYVDDYFSGTISDVDVVYTSLEPGAPSMLCWEATVSLSEIPTGGDGVWLQSVDRVPTSNVYVRNVWPIWCLQFTINMQGVNFAVLRPPAGFDVAMQPHPVIASLKSSIDNLDATVGEILDSINSDSNVWESVLDVVAAIGSVGLAFATAGSSTLVEAGLVGWGSAALLVGSRAAEVGLADVDNVSILNAMYSVFSRIKMGLQWIGVIAPTLTHLEYTRAELLMLNQMRLVAMSLKDGSFSSHVGFLRPFGSAILNLPYDAISKIKGLSSLLAEKGGVAPQHAYGMCTDKDGMLIIYEVDGDVSIPLGKVNSFIRTVTLSPGDRLDEDTLEALTEETVNDIVRRVSEFSQYPFEIGDFNELLQLLSSEEDTFHIQHRMHPISFGLLDSFFMAWNSVGIPYYLVGRNCQNLVSDILRLVMWYRLPRELPSGYTLEFVREFFSSLYSHSSPEIQEKYDSLSV